MFEVMISHTDQYTWSRAINKYVQLLGYSSRVYTDFYADEKQINFIFTWSSENSTVVQTKLTLMQLDLGWL